MKVVDRKTVIHNMGNTRTVQNFNKLLGDKPHKLGLVATMYPELSMSILTDALNNVFYNKQVSGNSFTPVNAMAIEWNIDVNFIPKVYIDSFTASDTNKPGLGKMPFTIYTKSKYYDKNDTFALQNGQQVMVIAPVRMINAKKWEHQVIIVGNDRSKFIDPRFLSNGRYSRYRSNFHAELSERGYTKYLSNTETHKNWLSRHRASESVSADYNIREDVYLQLSKKSGVEYYKMHKYEKDALDTFMMARNNSMLFSETNFDSNGKCMDQDEYGRDVPMGDGVIPQITRYCDKFFYNELTSDIMDDVLFSLAEKSDRSTGNTYAVPCNDRLYQHFGKVAKSDYRFNSPNDATFMYSKDKGGKIKIGAEFTSYTFQGNTLIFMPDRALSQEYPDFGYGVFLDTTADVRSGKPNLAAFTLDGSEMVEGYVNGLGGKDGKTSGNVSTGVHGSEYHLIGYSVSIVFNPHKSFILREDVPVY